MNDKCSEKELCNELVGLSCQEGSCKCAASDFWKDNKCGKEDIKKT